MKSKILSLIALLVLSVSLITQETNALVSHGDGMLCMLRERPARYAIAGDEFPKDLQSFLYDEFDKYDMTWFVPYAICQMYQESRFDRYAQNPNGLDKGILQFRTTYWFDYLAAARLPILDIFDPYAQISAYAYNVYTKRCAGESLYDIISDHYTGGAYYDQNYVSDVLQWHAFYEERY